MWYVDLYNITAYIFGFACVKYRCEFWEECRILPTFVVPTASGIGKKSLAQQSEYITK